MRAIDIKWDTDGDEEILKTLPKEMDIPDDVCLLYTSDAADE